VRKNQLASYSDKMKMRMSYSFVRYVAIAVIGMSLANVAIAGTIYESATLGPTGFTIQQLLQGEAKGSNVS
jgi:hypothetical protein